MENLTGKQHVTLAAAVDMGYFQVPRQADQSDLADELGVTEQAVSERLRRACETVVAEAVEA